MIGVNVMASAASGGAAAAAAAAIANAIKASGVLITVEPDVFEMIAHRQKEPLIVHSFGGFFGFGMKHTYLTSYKGLAFTTRSTELLDIPYGSEIIESKSIAIPG